MTYVASIDVFDFNCPDFKEQIKEAGLVAKLEVQAEAGGMPHDIVAISSDDYDALLEYLVDYHDADVSSTESYDWVKAEISSI